jgi:hypothetical protein
MRLYEADAIRIGFFSLDIGGLVGGEGFEPPTFSV